jgi:oligopeptide/dipeptide ABC transporter ATP-binding protein
MEVPPLLQVDSATVRFPGAAGLWGRKAPSRAAVDAVSFSIRSGEMVGLVGESGCGKTTLGRALLRLTPLSSGSIRVGGVRVDDLSESDFRPYRRRLQMVFQDPTSTLDPRWRVGESIGEALDIHGLAASSGDRRDRIARLLDSVGLPADAALRHPHEFSGGQRQRIGIARALAVEPELLVCDEPVSALDVSVQAQIVNLFADLNRRHGLAGLFISHDLAVVGHLCSRVLVMYLGSLVEVADAGRLLSTPAHPYSRALLDAVPSIEVPPAGAPGPEGVPSASVAESSVGQGTDAGCRYCNRCPRASERCVREVPALRPWKPDWLVACHHPMETGPTVPAA